MAFGKPFISNPDLVRRLRENAALNEPKRETFYGGGAAGYETDIYDLSIGTPPHTLLIASSESHSTNYQLVPEYLYFPHPGMHGTEHPLVRADITYGGQFRVNGGDWADIPGTATITGGETTLTVMESRARLVTGDG